MGLLALRINNIIFIIKNKRQHNGFKYINSIDITIYNTLNLIKNKFLKIKQIFQGFPGYEGFSYEFSTWNLDVIFTISFIIPLNDSFKLLLGFTPPKL